MFLWIYRVDCREKKEGEYLEVGRYFIISFDYVQFLLFRSINVSIIICGNIEKVGFQ